MKILRQGKSKSELEAWAGTQLRCGHCQCVFELEAGEIPARKDGMRVVGCPNCDQNIYVEMSRITKAEQMLREIGVNVDTVEVHVKNHPSPHA